MEQQLITSEPKGGIFSTFVTNYVTMGIIRVWLQDSDDKITHRFVAISEVDDTEEDAEKIVSFLAETAKAKGKTAYVSVADDFTKYIRIDGSPQIIWVNKGLCKMTENEAKKALRVSDLINKL